MTTHAPSLRHPAGAALALAAVAGLVLTGCSTASSGSSGGSGSTSGKAASSSSASTGGSTSVVSSASVPFPVGVGDTWTYKTTFGQTVNKMTAVTPVAGGQQVTMAGAITTEGNTSDTTAYYIVHSDGSISLPFSQFSSSASSGSSVKLISGSIFWPPAAELASGQASHDTLQIEFSQGGKQQEVTAHVTVQGAGTQSVTVPAGTYSATVVDMTMSETVVGIAVTSEVKTWLATGVGPVQSEVVADEGGTSHVLDENQLVSYQAG
jgi:hypothetical protein